MTHHRVDKPHKLQRRGKKRNRRQVKLTKFHELYKLQNGKCFYCSVMLQVAVVKKGRAAPMNLATIDHKRPTSRGGTWSNDNIVLACWRCNNAKGSMTHDEYVASGRWKRRERGDGGGVTVTTINQGPFGHEDFKRKWKRTSLKSPASGEGEGDPSTERSGIWVFGDIVRYVGKKMESINWGKHLEADSGADDARPEDVQGPARETKR